MNRSSYRERDYVFGQVMLTLRTASGLTQAGLADLLGVSRQAVVGWEAGNSYPKADHLKRFLALCVQQQAFPAGREAEEIRALWKAAHSKVLLDEQWLVALLSPQPPPVPREESGDTQKVLAPGPGRRVSWSDELAVPSFYGREWEQTLLAQWVVEEHCRVVSVLGLGGIGKSALAVSLMHRLAEHFDVVIWRSLRDAPSCEALLDDCLQVLAPQSIGQVPANLERRLGLLLECLRGERALVVLDNLETLLEEGEGMGRMLPGYEGYGRLLRRVAETEHQSCLLFTSREKPSELVPFEGSRAPVRALRLARLGAVACKQLLEERKIVGDAEDRARLIERYGGNPLALQIVAETITDLFDGEIGPFLAQESVVFGSIASLLDEQVARLSALERMLLRSLAVLREPVTLEELRALLVAPLRPVQILEAVESLRRRSLIERGQRSGSLTRQTVVLEYVTDRLVEDVAGEIEGGRPVLLVEQALIQALAKDYVRQSQERLIGEPILQRLQAEGGAGAAEQRLLGLLDGWRDQSPPEQGYGPGNVVNLLRLLRGHLRGLDLSRLAIRGAYLQGVELQDANLSGALLQESVLTEALDAIWAVAISQSGQYWAAAGRRGEVRLWSGAGQTLHRVWQAHTDIATALAFSPDERLLASGSADGSVKLWDVEGGTALWSGGQASLIFCVAFASDGGLLAGGRLDATVRLWDPKLGTLLKALSHPGPVSALAWSPDGHLLATGDDAGTIRLWEIGPSHPATCVESLEGHSSWVWGLAFAPYENLLASASWDGSVKLWELGEAGSLRLRQTLVGHTQQVQPVVWSPDGGTLASGSWDHTIRLWDAKQGLPRVVLSGHRAAVHGLAFTPDSRSLLSGSPDGTLRLWEVERGQCVRVLQGYDAGLYDLDWSPDGTQLATAGSESVVSLWQVESLGGGAPRGELRGHGWSVYGVAWRPDGGVLASSGWDNAIRLWDSATSNCLQVISDRDHPDTLFWGLAWSPDGKHLAGATSSRGVLVWEVEAGAGRWIGRELPVWIRRVAWSPDGTRLVAGGEDGHVYVWDAMGGSLLQRLAGHQGSVISVAWSPDGTQLASGGDSQGSGELFVWDARSGERMSTLQGLTGAVYAVAWHPVGKLLISGGSDGRLCWWDLPSGACVRVREAHQGIVQALKVSPDGRRLASCGNDGTITLWELERGHSLGMLRHDRPYERMNITGITGLTAAQKATLRGLGAVEQTRSSEFR